MSFSCLIGDLHFNRAVLKIIKQIAIQINFSLQTSLRCLLCLHMLNEITNVNIEAISNLATPQSIRDEYGRTEEITNLVIESRKTIKRIISGEDSRPLIIVGPCSIHDPKAADEYAERLIKLHHELIDDCYIIMRAYFEKPRTTMGWKGLINDPDMNQGYNIEKGLKLARSILLNILSKGLPTASEMLDTIVPQYIADLVCWASLGARTTESQPHREMSSGLSMPVGFKNSTTGDPTPAINAMKVACHPHSFVGTNKQGQISFVKTTGNQDVHLILRGGDNGPNFNPITIKECAEKLINAGLPSSVLIDCSHGNSKKKHVNQPAVFNNVMHQRQSDNNYILGVMLESNLHEGNQPTSDDLSQLHYGVSVTDECMNWETTEMIIRNAFKKS